MVFSVLHYHFSKSLPCPFLLLTLPQRCSYALYPKDSSLLSIYRLFKFRLRLHCIQIVNKRVRLHEYLKMCWTNTSPPTSNPSKSDTTSSRWPLWNPPGQHLLSSPQRKRLKSQLYVSGKDFFGICQSWLVLAILYSNLNRLDMGASSLRPLL